MKKTCVAGKKRSITGELQKRRGFGKKNTVAVLRLNSMKGGALAGWDRQGGHQDLWDHAHLWRELVIWGR